jgi:hypothetical protein
VAHALLRAASALMPTPGSAARASVEKSLDTARRSACATEEGQPTGDKIAGATAYNGP